MLADSFMIMMKAFCKLLYAFAPFFGLMFSAIFAGGRRLLHLLKGNTSFVFWRYIH